MCFGFWVWGAALGLVSEIAFRLPIEKIKKYHWAFLAGSVPLFLTAFSIAFIWDKPVLTFGVFALTALVYASLHLVHPRWYVWTAALLSGLCAYFIFFSLPIIERLETPYVYQLLIGSILLVVPELFTRTPISLKTESRWPAIAFGIIVSILGIGLALAELEHTGRGALTLIVYALLISLHAVHGKRPWLGYFASLLESLAIIYALDHYHLDLWLPALTLLSVLYYATGFFFRRRADELNAWGSYLHQ